MVVPCQPVGSAAWGVFMVGARWGWGIAGLRAGCLAVGLGGAAPGVPAADPMVPVRQFLDGFNRGDTAAGFAAYAPGTVSIIDEFAPHLWVGADALRQWAAAYDADASARGVTDGRVEYGAPLRVETGGGTAYVVVPTRYVYRERGRAMAEPARLAVSLRTVGGAWKIAAWAWAGTVPGVGR